MVIYVFSFFKTKNYIPDEYQKSIYNVDFNKLYDEGYRIILTDLDNTLVSYDDIFPTNEIIEWLDKVKAIGFEVVVTSNNKKKRVKTFCDKLGIRGIWWSLKPLKRGFRKALRKTNYKKNQVVVMGDQLMTDVCSAKRAGYYTILIKAVKRKTEKWVTRFNRKNEIKKLKKIEAKYKDLYELKLKEYVGDNYGY